jgi:hypothetical protein
MNLNEDFNQETATIGYRSLSSHDVEKKWRLVAFK